MNCGCGVLRIARPDPVFGRGCAKNIFAYLSSIYNYMKKKISLALMSLLYVLAGINHFVHPLFYSGPMPPYLPFPMELIYISGVCELVLGLLLIPAKTRKLAASLIILMLILFFTVHIQMIVNDYQTGGIVLWIAIIRLPLQFVLIYWALKISRYRGRFVDLP